MKNNNVALGMFAGIAIGTVLGIIFAPAKGSETRKIITDKGFEFNDNLKDSICKLSDKITQTISELKKDSQKLMGNTNNILEEEKANLNNLNDINKSMFLG